ncbi:MAG: DUF192 domain-containing protein [bacterium]|nr:DUF192 domain-containing protein [bacterium]
MKQIVVVVALFVVVLTSGCTQQFREAAALETLQVGEHSLQVAVMRTPEEIQQGLSGSDKVPGDGMLFLLPERQEAHFWMKDMRYPIDIIWIDDDRVVGVAEQVPPPSDGQSLDSLPLFSSGQPVTAVLEVPAGDFRRLELATSAAVLFQ